MQTNNSILRIEERIQDGEQNVKQGAIYRRKFTLQTLEAAGEVSVNVWLDVADPQFNPLLLWYSFSPSPPLALKPGEPADITLSFEIPLQAKPGLYNYRLILDCLQYPEQRQSRPLQINILPAGSEVLSEPDFSLEPATTSADPHSLKDGETLALTINVTNRSNLTDRFYVNCPDLPKSWYTRRYPASVTGGSHFPSETNGLQLNPNDTGQITLLLHPPRHTLAGNYCVTIQLTSQNNPEFTLLDAVYLELEPDPALDCQLTPASQIIPQESGEFTVRLKNEGNLRRSLLMQVSDRERLFRYRPRLAEVELEPGGVVQIPLRAKPRKFWRRSWRGKDLEFQFDLELTNRVTDLTDSADPSEAEVALLPKLPEPLPQGTIIWKSRPIWLLWLLIFLALATIAGLLFALWFNFLRPRVTPEVLSFRVSPPANPQKNYQEGRGEQIRLNWEISHLEQIKQVTVIGLQRGTEVHRQTFAFPNGTIESHLALQDPDTKAFRENNFCTAKADEPPKGRSRIALKPVDLWGLKILLPAVETNPSSVLTCQGIITPIRQAGDYTFQMQVFTTTRPDTPIVSATTDSVAVKPIDKPQITDFAPTQLVYQEANSSLMTSQRTSQGMTINQVSDTSLNSTGVVRLNWSIVNIDRVQEIQLIGASAGGTGQSEMKRYRFINGVLPPELKNRCDRIPVGANGNLNCRNIPTQAGKPGEYTFKLVVIYREAQSLAEITRSTEAVKITPKPLEIVSFRINNQEVKQNPKQVYLLDRQGSVLNIALSWIVRGGEGTKVEITPAPGLVPLQGQITYSLSAPSNETMTITVSNPSGAQSSQSVVVQTLQAQQPPRPAASTSASGGAAPPPPRILPVPPDASPSPTPSPSDLFPPIEVPPRPN